MSDGFRYSEKDSHVDSRSPWIKGDHDESDKDSAVNRAGWGDNVSPLVLNMKPVDNTPGGPDPNANGTNGQKPWRAGWAQVAPAASHLPQADTTSGQDPNQVNSPSPWRAGFGGSNGVAPDAQRLQPVDATSANSTQNAPSPWRSSYPDSSYKGPDTVQPGNPNLSLRVCAPATPSQQSGVRMFRHKPIIQFRTGLLMHVNNKPNRKPRANPSLSARPRTRQLPPIPATRATPATPA